MSTPHIQQTAQDYWDSVKAQIVSLLDGIASCFQWLILNIRLILFNLAVLPILGLVYWSINSVGLRMSASALATKIHKLPIPGLSVMRHYHGWRDIDLANVFAILQLALVWVAAVLLMHVMLYGGFQLRNVNERFVREFVLTVGVLLLLGDAALFYVGVGETGGLLSSGAVSFTQILITIVYTCVLLFVAFLHVLLENR